MKIKVEGHAWNGFEIRFLKSFGWMIQDFTKVK